MSINITTSDRISLGGAWDNSATLVRQSIGDAVLPAVTLALSYGTGNNQVDAWYVALRTLALNTSESIDLAGGLTTPEGAAFSFATVKRIVIVIQDPDGTKSLQIGPRNVSNAIQLGFGGVGAEAFDTTYNFWWKERPITGWTVTAGTGDLLVIKNPSMAAAITYGIWILGVKV